MVLPEGLVTLDGHEVAPLGGELAVHVGGGHLDGFVGGEAGRGFAHGGEHDGEVLLQLGFEGVEYVFLVAVDVVPEGLALVEGEVLDAAADFRDGVLVGLDGGGDVGAHLVDLVAELVVGELFEAGAESVDFIYDGFDFAQVALRLVAENLP